MSKKRVKKKSKHTKSSHSNQNINSYRKEPMGTMVVSEWEMFRETLKNSGVNAILYDFTYRDFPLAIETLHMDPTKMLSNIVKDTISDDMSIEDANKELNIKQKMWNALPFDEKTKRLKDFFPIEKFHTDIEKIWKKNYYLTRCHKSFFTSLYRTYSLDETFSENHKNYVMEIFDEYKLFVENWKHSLLENEEWLKETIKHGITRNTVAAYSNLFTTMSLTNIGSSYFNLLREICLRDDEVNDLLIELWPTILRFIIKKEKEVINNIKDLFVINSLEEFYSLMSKKSWNEFWNLSYGNKFKGLNKLKSSEFGLIKTLIEGLETDDMLFPEFNEISEIKRFEHNELVNEIVFKGEKLGNHNLFEGFSDQFGEGIRENILRVRNLLLFRKTEITEIFLKGNSEELKLMNYWFTINTDKSILSGIFMIRDILPLNNREIIINKAIDIQILRNSQLLSLNNEKMLEWMILGVADS